MQWTEREVRTGTSPAKWKARIKVMGTTAATIDSTLTPDCGSLDKLEREMDDALLRYTPSFYRIAFRRVGNAADAEDAVQDALLSAHKHLRQFRGQARISTWLSAIVINSARMQLRRRSRQPRVLLDERNPDQESYALCDRLPDPGPTPEEACRRAELAEHVHRLVRQLSPTLRRAFQLRELDGLTIRETANVLGVAEGTVKAQLARARTKLRLLMRKTLGPRLSRPPKARFLAGTPTRKSALAK
jgi:RNA polymerase sigma-70 factor (ECF subfamily)